jgi:uncharacterized protein YbjT (DUF2867 family)
MGAVVVFGAAGGVGRHAVAQLLGAGQDVIAVVRDPAKGTPLANAGARVVTHDLQHDPRRLARHLNGADSVLFAAGVHYGAPLDQRRAVDRGGAAAAVAAAREVGADRFVQVSAIGVDSGPPPGFDDAWWTSYYAAKHAADEALRTSGLRWTVIRPGALSDAAPTGHVRLSESLPLREIPRADIASLGIAILGDAASVGHTWDATSGPIAIRDAVRSALVPYSGAQIKRRAEFYPLDHGNY